MSAGAYKQEFCAAVLEMLWSQWTQLGVAGYAGEGAVPRVLDPEALLVFSAGFCRYDQRLYDVVAGWLIQYGSLVSIPRLKSLLKKGEACDRAALGYMVFLAAKHGHKRWKSLAESLGGHEGAEPMFRDAGEDEPLHVAAEDADALEYGLVRNPFEYAPKVSATLPETAATALLRLRGCMGVGARAEILLLLLQGPCSAAGLVRRSGYGAASVHETLQDLCLGQMVEPLHGARRLYLLRRAEPVAQLAGVVRECLWPDWSGVYNALAAVWRCVSNPRLARVSDMTFWGELERVSAESVLPAFASCGIPELERFRAMHAGELPRLVAEVLS